MKKSKKSCLEKLALGINPVWWLVILAVLVLGYLFQGFLDSSLFNIIEIAAFIVTLLFTIWIVLFIFYFYKNIYLKIKKTSLKGLIELITSLIILLYILVSFVLSAFSTSYNQVLKEIVMTFKILGGIVLLITIIVIIRSYVLNKKINVKKSFKRSYGSILIVLYMFLILSDLINLSSEHMIFMLIKLMILATGILIVSNLGKKAFKRIKK